MRIPSLVDLTCKEVTELVTEYMTDDMTIEDRARFEQHLHACTWCMTYLRQMRRTVDWTSQLGSETEPSAEQKLAEVFRRWKRERA
jgi:predicted anti-sigma-YlaC factor YlaD